MPRQRKSKLAIPNTPSNCTIVYACPYRNSAGACDEPRTNKGNSDAACHKMRNVDLITKLERSDG